MNIITTFSTIAYITYLYFGFYVFFKDTKSWTNRFFLAFSLCIAIWCFCITWLNIGVNEASEHIWQKAAYVGAIPYPYFILVCFLNMTSFVNRVKHKTLFYIVLSIIPCIYFYKNISTNIMFELPKKSFWYYTAHLYAFIYIVASLSVLFIWGIKSKYRRVKKQVATIIYPGLILLIVALIIDLTIKQDYPYSFSSTSLLIWDCFVGYAIINYNFFEINLKQATDEIISNIDEHLVLMDDLFYIKYIHRTLFEELGIDFSKYNHQHISKLINEFEDLISEIKKMEHENITSLSCRVHMLDSDKNQVMYDAKIKMLKDKFNDTTGYLMISNKIQDALDLKKIFNITKRENTIIQKIFEGKTNKETAEELEISERTVRNHLTNIFQKTGVNNRTQLFATLQKFNQIPSIPSQKIIFLSLKT